MVIDMQCPNCGSFMDDDWSFCPACGKKTVRKKNEITGFSNVFNDIEKEMRRTMDDIFEKNFEAFDARPFFVQKPISGKGFSIKITTKNGEKPEVSVRTFGDVDPEKVKRNVSKCIGCAPEKKEEKGESITKDNLHKDPPKVTEEPATNVRRMGESVVIEVKVPGVKDIGDATVQDLENSVEVRARAGDKAYFKIITKPDNFKLADTKFSNETLFLEFK